MNEIVTWFNLDAICHCSIQFKIWQIALIYLCLNVSQGEIDSDFKPSNLTYSFHLTMWPNLLIHYAINDIVLSASGWNRRFINLSAGTGGVR